LAAHEQRLADRPLCASSGHCRNRFLTTRASFADLVGDDEFISKQRDGPSGNGLIQESSKIELQTTFCGRIFSEFGEVEMNGS
jgi:hypothetical protein